MYLERVNQSCVCERNSRQAVLYRPTQHTPEEGTSACEFVLKYVQIVHFYAFFNHFSALFYPYIAHERTTQNLCFVSSLLALRSYSYWAPLLPKLRFAQERLSNFKERCTQLCINQKLFSRAIVAHHKILILLKGHFTINKGSSSIWTALQFEMVCTILDEAVFIVIITQGFLSFLHFGPSKMYSRITASLLL